MTNMGNLDSIIKDNFIRYDDSLFKDFHSWGVVGILGGGRYLNEELRPEDYDTPEDMHEALLDVIRNMRFSDTEYYVFCDEKLVFNF